MNEIILVLLRALLGLILCLLFGFGVMGIDKVIQKIKKIVKKENV